MNREQQYQTIKEFFGKPERFNELEESLNGLVGKKTLNIYSREPSPLARFLSDHGAVITPVNPRHSEFAGNFMLSYQTGEFDLVICEMMLFGTPQAIAEDTFRVLAPGGNYLSDWFGYEKEHLCKAGFVDVKMICNNAFLHARKPQ